MAGKDGHDGRPVLGDPLPDALSGRHVRERIVEVEEDRDNEDEEVFNISKVM